MLRTAALIRGCSVGSGSPVCYALLCSSPLYGIDSYPSFTDEESEPHGGSASCLRAHVQQVGHRFDPRPVAPELKCLAPHSALCHLQAPGASSEALRVEAAGAESRARGSL